MKKISLLLSAIKQRGLKQSLVIIIKFPLCLVYIFLLFKPGAFLRRRGLVKSKRYDRLVQFKDRYLYERCFIVCTGSSLTIEDLEMLKSDVCISMNSIVKLFDKTSWRPEYICCADNRVYSVITDHIEQGIKNGDIRNLFLPTFFLSPAYCSPYKCRVPKSDNIYYIPVVPTKPRRSHLKFGDDISIEVVAHATVTYVALQIAVYMGFKEIYLLGCDFGAIGSKVHSAGAEYAGITERMQSMVHKSKKDFIATKKYADEHDIKIYNATRGGKLEVFERVDFDSLF